MALTLSFATVTFPCVVAISFSVFVMDSVILSLVCSSFCNASRILPEETFVPSLSCLISSATTAKPFPASPALAASMEAFSASRFVWLVIFSIVPVSSFTMPNSALNSFRFVSISADSSAISFVESTTSESCPALFFAFSTDCSISVTISWISEATFSTCSLILSVACTEERVLSLSTSLLEIRSSMLFTTSSAPAWFSSASSRTTLTPSTTELLAVFTFSMLWTTLSRFVFTAASIAPSDCDI